MATKMVTYLDGFLQRKSHDPLIMWPCDIKLQTKTIVSSLLQCLWPPILAGWWLTLRCSYSLCYSILWSRGPERSRDNKNHYISTATTPLASKLDRGETYLKGVPLTWSSKITRQTKTIISPLPQCLWPSNLTRWWLTLSAFYHKVTWPYNHMVLGD